VTVAAATLVGQTVLAAKVSNDDVTPGVLGFLVVAGIGVALYFLLRSMNKQLRKLPPPTEEEIAAAGAKPLSPLQAAAARRREAAAAEKAAAGKSPGDRSARGGPDTPNGLG
jgi:hypothetical protein